MNIKEGLIKELKHQAANTRKLLERVPAEHFDWKPHEKSMHLGRLASHIAETIGWVSTAITENELDFAKREYKPTVITTNADLIKILDEKLAPALADLETATNEILMQEWTLRNGEQIYFTLPKVAVIRDFAFNHSYHHRGQLTVYLRMLDIPVPGMFGPTADERM
jgi:uncharacterized damage-inducible protein DinB